MLQFEKVSWPESEMLVFLASYPFSKSPSISRRPRVTKPPRVACFLCHAVCVVGSCAYVTHIAGQQAGLNINGPVIFLHTCCLEGCSRCFGAAMVPVHWSILHRQLQHVLPSAASSTHREASIPLHLATFVEQRNPNTAFLEYTPSISASTQLKPDPSQPECAMSRICLKDNVPYRPAAIFVPRGFADTDGQAFRQLLAGGTSLGFAVACGVVVFTVLRHRAPSHLQAPGTTERAVFGGGSYWR